MTTSPSTTTTAPVKCLSVVPSRLGAKVLTLDKINPHVREAQYAVRGEMAIRAEALREKLEHLSGKKPTSQQLPFDQIVHCNIGNPQQMGQKPVTFLRQVTALLEYTTLLDPHNEETALKLFPKDAILRARKMFHDVGPVGAYSHSQGVPSIRQKVARFIEERDGYPANPDHIFLSAGASPGIQSVLQLLIAHPKVGIMVPVPGYPLYTATIGLFNGQPVPYYLDESNGWGLTAKELRRALESARREQGLEVRALCVINPGNPTGSILTKQDMREILELCRDENLVLLADEVYQANVYYPEERPWCSFKKARLEGGQSFRDVELISFHSISKGMFGECGRRGAYFECEGIEEDALNQLYKVASISLCPNVSGQIGVDLMVDPPRPGDESYDLFKTEITFQYESLKRRAQVLCDAFNSLEGVTCNRAEGSMYLFPKIDLPQRAVEAARASGREPDLFYTLALLEATGVCMVPGSGFQQVPGTYHFRSTILPDERDIPRFVENVQRFHAQFMSKYR